MILPVQIHEYVIKNNFASFLMRLVKFGTGKRGVQRLGRNNPMRQCTAGADCLENSWAEKDLGLLVDAKSNVISKQKRPAVCWAALGRA